MTYSRTNPSPRYQALLELYKQMHRDGEKARGLSAEQTYPGRSLFPHLVAIRELVQRTGAQNVLDYGSGKGMAYAMSPIEIPGEGSVDGLIDYWDVNYVHCYDPCYAPYAKYPEGRFDGVITTDVLEHCPEEDIDWILGELFGFADKFVYASIACYPAMAILPNGENAHCTVRPVTWWRDRFLAAGRRKPGLLWRFSAIVPPDDGGSGGMRVEVCEGQ